MTADATHFLHPAFARPAPSPAPSPTAILPWQCDRATQTLAQTIRGWIIRAKILGRSA